MDPQIKVRANKERGGRLAKLDELAANLKRLERVALDNSTYLTRIFESTLCGPPFVPLIALWNHQFANLFREELRVLRHIQQPRTIHRGIGPRDAPRHGCP